MSVQASFAQQMVGDTAFLSQARHHALSRYRQAVGEQAHVFNGPEYIQHHKHFFKGHPFFITDSLTQGGVYYDGAWHCPLPLLYDVVTDEVITANQGALQKLLPEKLKAFRLRGHSFVYLPKDSLAGSSLQPGIYELLYNHATKVYARHSKQAQEFVEKGQMAGTYEPATKYFILKEGRYHPVNSQGSVLKVFEENKKLLKKHLNSRNLKFGKQKQEAIVEAAKFYDTQ
ncbi:hypothetical protein ACMA1I_04925 [Pontibacter sp. 13R65]|uniref:hypothetical protein n=1 Tax=Pontibacter sp. 13R65 TaxID=3127458 RepID=UPI00301C72C6